MKKQLATTSKTITATNDAETISPEVMEKVLIGADLGPLNPAQRLSYYQALTTSLKLNPLTRPFEYLMLDGKTVLYARKDCTEQLRSRDSISIKILSRQMMDGVYVVTAAAKNREGREDEDVGAVPMIEPDYVREWSATERKKVWVANKLAGQPMFPEDRATQMMKAETKAKRRVTLSLCGLGIPDESEIEDLIRQEEGRAPMTPINREKQAEDNVRQAAANRDREQQPEPETGIADNTPPQETPPEDQDWQEVESHVGMANGPLLGKKLGELPPRLINWLNTNWRAKLNPAATTPQDKALLTAVTQAVIAGADKEKPEATPAEDKKASPSPVSAPKNTPPAPTETRVPAKEEPMEWRTVAIHLPGKATGKTLGDLYDLSDGHLRAVGPLIEKYMAKEEDKRSLKDRILVNAYAAALEETGVAMNEKQLRAAILERIDDLALTVDGADELLRESGVYEADASVRTVDEEVLRYLMKNWQTIEETIKTTLNPPAVKKGKGK